MNSSLTGHILTSYYAPRGRSRIFELGIHLAQQYSPPLI